MSWISGYMNTDFMQKGSFKTVGNFQHNILQGGGGMNTYHSDVYGASTGLKT